MKPLTWISTISALAISVGLMGISRVTKQNVILSKSGLLPSSQINSQLDTAKAIAHTAYAQLPLYFETNQGQTNDQVKFLSRGNGYTLFLTPTEAVLALQQSVIDKQQSASKTLALDLPASESEVQSSGTILRMRLVGANSTPRIAGLDQLPGKSNYLIGDDAEKWRTNIPTYAKVKYEDVYPGVDLIYYGNQRQLEYDFVVAPGANPQIITFGFEAADKLEVDARGDLVLHTTGGQIKLHKPLVYQEMDGARQEIFGSYVLLGSRDSELRTHEVGFEVAAYDASKFLVIDPILSYSTYLGGSYSTFGGNNTDEGVGIGVDSSGNAYVAGITSSTDFPTVNPLQAVHQGGSPFPFDVFVTKLNAEGSAILYSTYLGGVGSDRALGFAVDASGNAYVAGETSSVNFPTVNPLQPTYSGGFDGFAAKLNPEGSGLLWSTYLGGNAQDASLAISADTSGNAYVTGLTSSSDFPTVNAFQPNLSSFTYEPFVTKFNPTGSTVYSTYLGGSSEDAGRGIAADTSGNAYVTGYTFSSDFPTANALQPALSPHPSGALDAFVTKLNPTGSALVYSTFLGGSFSEHGDAIAVDSSGNAYVTGFTNSTNFPTVNPLQPTLLGGQDAFVLKINPAGSALVYSSYLGGSGFDRTFSIAVDSSGNAHLTGFTRSNDFPVVDPLQGTIGGGGSPCAPFEFESCDDAFVAKLNPAGSALVYSTYLGGNDEDRGNGIAVDQAGHAYVTGYTRSSNFPTVNPVQPTLGGFRNAFVAKIESTGGTNPPPTANAQSVATQEDTSLTITLEATNPAAIPLTFSIVTPPTKGSLSAITDLSCTEGDCTASVIYTPNTDFNGSDSFTFKANDAFADSAPATVSITVDAVNDAPAANPDSAIATTTSVTISVLDNDTDVEGDALSVLSVTQGGNGAVSFDAATITYTLTVYFSGTDSFTYVVSDGHGGTGTATVTITVSVPASSGVNLVSSQVASLNLGGGQATGLTSTLQVAQHSLVNGNRTSAINQLNAFINQVEALKLSGQLAPPLADSLIAQAQALINGI